MATIASQKQGVSGRSRPENLSFAKHEVADGEFAVGLGETAEGLHAILLKARETFSLPPGATIKIPGGAPTRKRPPGAPQGDRMPETGYSSESPGGHKEDKWDKNKQEKEKQRQEEKAAYADYVNKLSQKMMEQIVVMQLTSQLVPVLSDTQTWLELGKSLKIPVEFLTNFCVQIPDPALRMRFIYQWHFANWIVSALLAINEKQLAVQLYQEPMAMCRDHFRVDRRFVYRRLGEIEPEWRKLGQKLGISQSKLDIIGRGKKPFLLAVLTEYDEDKHFVKALRSIGEKSLADKIDATRGVTLTEVMPLALKRDKWSAVKSKLKIRNPEEESLMEMMSRSSAQEMVTTLISDHIRQDQKAVLDLIGESLPPQEKVKTPEESTKYKPHTKMSQEQYMTAGGEQPTLDPIFMNIQVSVRRSRRRRRSVPWNLHLLTLHQPKEPTTSEGAVGPEEQLLPFQQLLLPFQHPSQGKAKLAPVPSSQPPSEGAEQSYPSPEDVQPVPPNQTPDKSIELPCLPSLPPAEDKEPQHVLQSPSKDTEATHPHSLKASWTFSKEPTSPEGTVDPEEQLLLPQPPSQGKAKLAPVPPSQPPSEDAEQSCSSPEDVQPVPPNQTPAKRIELPCSPFLPPAEDKEPQHVLQSPSKDTEATHPHSLKALHTLPKEPTSPEGAVDPEEQLLLPQPPSQGKAKLAPVPPSQPPSEDTEQLYPSPEDSVQPVPPNQTPAKRIELPSLPSLPPAEDKEPQHLLQPPSKVTEATHPRSLKAPQTFSKDPTMSKRELLRQILLGSEGESSDDDSESESSEHELSDDDTLASGAPTGEGGQEQPSQSTETRKLSEISYKEYLREFDEVFESRQGFSVQSNITGAILNSSDRVRGVDLGTIAANVPDPNEPGERYEIRPCLKVIVHDQAGVIDSIKQKIAEAVVKSIEEKYGPTKRFSSEDYSEWLDFIMLSDESTHLLSDNEASDDTQQDPVVELKPGAQFTVESSRGTWGFFAQNVIRVGKDTYEFHHGLTCAHCVLPPDSCLDIVESRMRKHDPSAACNPNKCLTPGGLYDQWHQADVSYLIPEEEQDSVRSQLKSIPCVGIKVQCQCNKKPCTCLDVRYDRLHRWLTLASLYPGKTADSNSMYGPQEAVGEFAGAIQGFYPAIDDSQEAPLECTIPVKNIPEPAGSVLRQDSVITTSHVNIDFGAVSVTIPDDPSAIEHTVKSVSPRHITKWKTALRFGRHLMPPSPRVYHVQPTAAEQDLPVYALDSKRELKGRTFNQADGNLATAQVIMIPETEGGTTFVKPGDSGCIVYTLHGAMGECDVTGVIFGMLYCGGTLQETRQARYFVFPLVRALKFLTPQLNYKNAQLLLRSPLLPETARKKLKKYAQRFMRAEDLKRQVLARTYDTDPSVPLVFLHEIFLAQCNDRKSAANVPNLSFSLYPCVSGCGEPSYCTDEIIRSQLEVPSQENSAEPIVPYHSDDEVLRQKIPTYPGNVDVHTKLERVQNTA